MHGQHHVHDLRRFLHSHYLAGNEVDAVYNKLLAQANCRARFEEECTTCHDTAATLVRNTLVLRDAVLYSRNSGRMVSHCLGQHMNLTPEDVEFFLNLLMRVTHEVYRP